MSDKSTNTLVQSIYKEKLISCERCGSVDWIMCEEFDGTFVWIKCRQCDKLYGRAKQSKV